MPIAEFDAALGNTERVFLDRSTLLAFHSPPELTHPLAKHLLDRIADDQDPVRGYFSAVSASEVLVRPLRAGVQEYNFMHDVLTRFPNLTILPVDLSVALQAATLRAATSIRLPDALIVASGLLASCEVIVSNDAQWRRRLAPLFPNFRWLQLGDYV
ncbi:MAG: type II toxin-antitoxin system VapC family toxin [Candidatus Dormibacteraceae bacterium]